MNDLTDITFDDDSRPVPSVEPEVYDEDPIRCALLEAGLPAAKANALAEWLDEELDRRAIEAAAETLGGIYRNQPVTPFTVALERVQIGANGESIRDAATRANCSHVAILKWEKKLKALFGYQ